MQHNQTWRFWLMLPDTCIFQILSATLMWLWEYWLSQFMECKLDIDVMLMRRHSPYCVHARRAPSSVGLEFSCRLTIIDARFYSEEAVHDTGHNYVNVNNKPIPIHLCLSPLSPPTNPLCVVIQRTLYDLWLCTQNTTRCIMNPAQECDI